MLSNCGVAYIDPQENAGNTGPAQDTLVYAEYFSGPAALRNYFVDINAFGGSQVDRARVYAIMPDNSLQLLGAIAFGTCTSCVAGFALVHNNSLVVEGVNTVNEMNMWIQSLNQPAYALPGNLQTLTGVGRISGQIPFCAIGWQVEYVVYSDPNNSSTEFATYIFCPQTTELCPIVKNVQLDCAADSIFLEATVPTGCFNGNVVVEWSNQSGWTSQSATAALPIDGNLGLYHLTVSDDFCTLVDSALVENPPFVQAGPDVTICTGEVLSLMGSGGAGHFWETPRGMVEDIALQFPDATADDTGNYILHAFNNEGCEDTDTLHVVVVTPPSPQLDIQEPCLGDTLFLVVENSGDYAQISWQGPSGNAITSGQVVNFQSTDAGSYTLVATDATGCQVTQTVDINGSLPPELEVALEESCDTVRVYLYPTTYTYVWNTGDTGPVFITSTGGNFQVTVTDPVGCSSVQPIDIPQPDGPDVSVDITQPPCPGDYGAVDIVAAQPNQPLIFSIDGGITYGVSDHFDGLTPGQYVVTVQDALGCILDFPVTILTPDTMGVELNIDSLEVRPNTLVTLTAHTTGNIQYYQWLPGSINSGEATTEFEALSDLNVRVIVEDGRGCRASDGFHLAVVLGDVYAPNAFSPNDDGINDGFTLYSDLLSGEVIQSLAIFNRWGDLVFKAEETHLNNERQGWDGKFRNKPASPGIYTYHAVIRYGNGVRRSVKGDIALLR